MGSVNKVILIGNLGRDAELKFTKSGTAVTTVGMATTDRYTDRDGNKKEDTQWHNVVVWGKTAEAIAQYLTKGKSIYVEGKLQTRKWTDKEGNDRYSTEVRADRVVLLGSRGDGGSSGRADDHDDHQEAAPATDDDIPF